MVAAGIYALYVRCQRWRLLLERAANRKIAMTPIFSASAIGFMANMVLPLRVGEFARPYLVARNTGIGLGTTLATVVLERVLDLFALFGFALWIASAADVPPAVSHLTWAAGVAVGLLFAGILTVHFNRRRLLPIVDRIWLVLPPRLGQRITRLEHEFLDALAVVADGWTLALAIAWSFYVWFVIAISFSIGFPALDVPIPFIGGGITVATLVALAVSLPGAPGFIGQFEWGCKLALEHVYGVAGATALAYAFVIHAVQWSVQVALGLVYVIREGLSLGELERLPSAEAAVDS